MVVETKIANYVKKAVSYLPYKMRAEAGADLEEMILDLVRDHAGTRKPDILDAREVLRELGRPEDMALSWIESRDGKNVRTSGPADWLVSRLAALDGLSIEKANHLLQVMTYVLSILAVLFVGFGLLALSTHVIDNMLPIFVGCVLALGVVAGRGALSRQSEI